MEKYGFVYIWYDRKHRRYYIGSHWGTEKDGYLCSSSWMKRSYKRRPQDFKRRILKIVNIRSNLLETEQIYLSMIKDHELKNRYYNLTNKIRGNWSHDSNKNLSVKQKISNSLKGKKLSDDHKRKISESKAGKALSSETKNRISDSSKGKLVSDEFRKKMSETNKGKILSSDHKRKISESNLGISRNSGKKHSEETRNKISQLQLGKKRGSYSKKQGELNEKV